MGFLVTRVVGLSNFESKASPLNLIFHIFGERLKTRMTDNMVLRLWYGSGLAVGQQYGRMAMVGVKFGRTVGNIAVLPW